MLNNTLRHRHRWRKRIIKWIGRWRAGRESVRRWRGGGTGVIGAPPLASLPRMRKICSPSCAPLFHHLSHAFRAAISSLPQRIKSACSPFYNGADLIARTLAHAPHIALRCATHGTLHSTYTPLERAKPEPLPPAISNICVSVLLAGM